MLSSVKQTMDRRLVQGMTYIYQEMQISIMIVTLSQAARTSVPQDRMLKHSSREKNILQLQITRCLDFTNNKPNIPSHMRGYKKKVKCPESCNLCVS